MKTVGIMSMQKIKNYGSFLQAYGLKKTIENLGYNVVFIDYTFEKSIINNSNNFTIINKIKKNLNVINYIKKKKIVNLYNRKFENDFIPDLYANNQKKYSQKNIDYLIIGSDEVFNCLQPYPVGYSRELFGLNFEKIPVSSYAASFGQTNYEKLCNYNIANEISTLLKKFKYISVRDDNSYQTINKLIGKYPEINLDPVLITDYTNELIDSCDLKDFIIVYAYPDRLSKEEKIEIKKFAKKHRKKIVSFGMYQEISDIEIVVNPFEIFSYFKKADFIITDTFHGSIFSIKTKSNFCTIIRNANNGNSNKLVDLLKRLELENRIINDIKGIDSIYKLNTDFSRSEKIIKKEQVKSINYLKKCLDWGEKNE